MFARLLTLAILGGGLYFLFKLARKAWRRSELKQDVEDKLDDLANEQAQAAKVVDINSREVRRAQKKLNDFDNL